MNNETALVQSPVSALVTTDVPAQFSAFGSIAYFEDAQRMAKALCSSSIVPETYRGPERIGDCIIALEIANRIGASVLAVMQNLYIVYGRPAWSSQFLISCVNASRKFTPLRYKMTGEKGTDSWGCVAWATDKTGENLESPEVTIGIAKAEGWFQKNGSKWKTMPELMLRYRAATLFARLYAPELTMGINTDEEVIDISPVVTDPVRTAKTISDSPNFGPTPTPAPAISAGAKTDAPVTTPLPKEQTSHQSAPALSVVKDNPDEQAESDAGLAPVAGAKTKAKPTQAELVDPNPKASGPTPQEQLQAYMEDQGASFEKFRTWASLTERLADADSVASWAELPTEFCRELLKDGKSLNKAVVRCKS